MTDQSLDAAIVGTPAAPPPASPPAAIPPAAGPPRSAQLHPLSRRVMHWVNALAIIVMIASGWRIYDSAPPLSLDLNFLRDVTLGGDPALSTARNNEDGLANALLWHFAAMWILVLNFLAYLTFGLFSGHFRRDFLPLTPKAFLSDFLAAMRFRLSHNLGEYNAVQKFAYWVALAAVSVTILSGLSIWKPVQLHELTSLFGGYDSARIVHFLGMVTIVGFLAVHIALTVLVPSTLVAMVTGGAAHRPRKRAKERLV